jgi:hypothetical protein
MRPIRLELMLASTWLAGCSLVYSPADRQLGPDEQNSPIHRSDDDDNDDGSRGDAGPHNVVDDQSSVDDLDDDDMSVIDETPETDESEDWNPDDDVDESKPDAGLDAGDVETDEDETDEDETEPDAGEGGMCEGTSGNWDGCRGDGCSVCTEKIAAFPLYLQNHPECVPNSTCNGEYYTCNARCPAPTEGDECHGSPGGWQGCRGSGCWVCAELLVDYPRYAQNHPSCIVNTTCDGQHYTCNAACPAPTDADR